APEWRRGRAADVARRLAARALRRGAARARRSLDADANRDAAVGRSAAMRAGLALLATLALTSRTAAQDFAPPAPAGPAPGAMALLERALPLPGTTWSAESAVTRWLGLASLETRACAVGGGTGPMRAALGLSQTGDPELGWTTAALAVGACTGDA